MVQVEADYFKAIDPVYQLLTRANLPKASEQVHNYSTQVSCVELNFNNYLCVCVCVCVLRIGGGGVITDNGLSLIEPLRRRLRNCSFPLYAFVGTLSSTPL